MLFCRILRGYCDVNRMNIVRLLGVERNHREIATDIAGCDRARRLRSRGAWLHGVTGLGGHLQARPGVHAIKLFDTFFSCRLTV